MKITVLVILFIHLLIAHGGAGDSGKHYPFYAGEKLTYSGRWGFIPAGEVVLEVLPNEIIAGVETYHFAMLTKTNAVVDLVYKIRERQDSFIDLNATHGILYKKRTESKHPSDIIINFDWATLQATRSDFGKESSPIQILPGSFDPLALFFILRLQVLKENVVIEIPVTDGHKNILVKATINKKESIRIDGKTYETFAITPDMEQLEQVVKKDDNPKLKIWLTADEKKIPVKIQSSVGLISFVFELVSIAP